MELAQTTGPSHSTISFSVSRFNAEINLTNHHDDIDLSRYNEGNGNSREILEFGVANLENEGNVTVKYKEKKSQQ